MNFKGFFKAGVHLFIIPAASALLFAPGCVAPIELTSTPSSGTITIDGNNTDWGNTLVYLEKEQVSVGVHDDGQMLSGCLITTDRFVQMQILSGGFSVWFDPHGGSEKRFGIRFPVRQSGPLPMMRGNESLTDVASLMAPRLQEAEILGSKEEDTQRFSVLQIPGVKVKIGVSGEALVYEFQVPIMPVANGPINLHEARGGILGMGFEAQGHDSDRLEGPSSRGPGSTGRGRRGMPSGPAAIGGGQRQELVDFWTLVHLTKVAP